MFAQFASVIRSSYCAVIPVEIIVHAIVVPMMGRNVQRDVENNLLGHIWLEQLCSSSEKLGRHRRAMTPTLGHTNKPQAAQTAKTCLVGALPVPRRSCPCRSWPGTKAVHARDVYVIFVVVLTVSGLRVSGQFLLSRATFLAAVVATESAAAWFGPLNAAACW